MARNAKLIIGNWKMNGLQAESRALVQAIVAGTAKSKNDIVLCPPATLLALVAEMLNKTHLEIGGQDCHSEANGAFTGDIAAGMLADIGAKYVIVGHSERRYYHHETSEGVAQKAAAALQANLTPVICVGESEDVRRSGKADALVAEELKKSLPAGINAPIVVAYEPLWAIGSGKTCSPQDITAMHKQLRTVLSEISPDLAMTRILYGGSVKPDNAREIMAAGEVDGVLVGGASLEAGAFTAIVAAAAEIG